MAFRLPRISIVTSDEQGAANMGELNMLSLGLGLHLAWMQAAFFDSTMPEEGPNGSFPFLFVVAMASFLATLLFAALTDQKLLPLYTARRAILPAAGSAALGSALLGWNAFGLAETPGIALPSSAMLGIGGALITLFWGTAFSRHDALTISMNASFACATALVVYTCALQALPTPWAGMAETTLPVLGAPLLWKLTPTSYAVRHEIPIFDPLPVNKASFAARLAFPLVLFGFCLGVMAMAARNVLTTFGEASQAPVLLGGAAITVLVVAGTTAADENGQWDLPFRLAVPLAMAALLLLPSLPSVAQDPAAPASLILAAGILCLSALLWSFFGDMAQQFRLSPLFLYGAGQSMLTLGVLLGVLATMKPEVLGVGPQEGGMAAVSAMALVLAFASLPRVRDVKRAIQQQSERTHGWANRAQPAEMAGRRTEAPEEAVDERKRQALGRAARRRPVILRPNLRSGGKRRTGDAGTYRRGWLLGKRRLQDTAGPRNRFAARAEPLPRAVRDHRQPLSAFPPRNRGHVPVGERVQRRAHPGKAVHFQEHGQNAYIAHLSQAGHPHATRTSAHGGRGA